MACHMTVLYDVITAGEPSSLLLVFWETSKKAQPYFP